MFTHLQQREIFHLIFLRHLARRVKPNTYALKGGVNLRFFFNSIRYSEDMDIDIQGVEVFQLKDIVMEILKSKNLATTLRPFHVEKIIPPNLKSAKQTETVQRFKTHLITSAGEDLFTKIEFSKRRLEPNIKTETINESVLFAYKQSPLLVCHYPIITAIDQKIRALTSRVQPQARDVFDIFMLFSQIGKSDLNKIKKNLSSHKLKKAEQTLFELSYAMFRDTVCNFLNDEDRDYYAQPKMWEEIQLKVAQVIL